jgi:probable lipoprotein NlpC
VPLARPLVYAALLLAACAGPGARREPLQHHELEARLAARARSLEGRSASFEVAGARFNADCSGFVEAVYEAEGVPLPRLMALAAPGARSAVTAAYRAVERFGTVFGRDPGEWPAPGDLVFFERTYDRDAGHAGDGPATHVGIVQWVEDGTVVFLHRGSHAVVRAVMTRARPTVAVENGRVLNSPLRRRSSSAGEEVLAGALFVAYGRIDPERVPPGAGSAFAPR